MEQKVVQKAPEQAKKPMPNMTGIPTQMKLDFERRSGLSFDDVRVHYNSDKPRRIGALAYTQIPQVHIGPGQERHLRHELGHVVQQKQGLVKPTTMIGGLPVNLDQGLEHYANFNPFIRKQGSQIFNNGNLNNANVIQMVTDEELHRIVKNEATRIHQFSRDFITLSGIRMRLRRFMRKSRFDYKTLRITQQIRNAVWENRPLANNVIVKAFLADYYYRNSKKDKTFPEFLEKKDAYSIVNIIRQYTRPTNLPEQYLIIFGDKSFQTTRAAQRRGHRHILASAFESTAQITDSKTREKRERVMEKIKNTCSQQTLFEEIALSENGNAIATSEFTKQTSDDMQLDPPPKKRARINVTHTMVSHSEVEQAAPKSQHQVPIHDGRPQDSASHFNTLIDKLSPMNRRRSVVVFEHPYTQGKYTALKTINEVHRLCNSIFYFASKRGIGRVHIVVRVWNRYLKNGTPVLKLTTRPYQFKHNGFLVYNIHRAQAKSHLPTKDLYPRVKRTAIEPRMQSYEIKYVNFPVMYPKIYTSSITMYSGTEPADEEYCKNYLKDVKAAMKSMYWPMCLKELSLTSAPEIAERIVTFCTNDPTSTTLNNSSLPSKRTETAEKRQKARRQEARIWLESYLKPVASQEGQEKDPLLDDWMSDFDDTE